MSKKLARSIADAARQMRQKFPDLEGYESVGTEGGLIQCRKPHWPDGVTISVPPTQGSNLAAVGANVVLGFYKAARQMPFIKSIRGMARGGTIEIPVYPGLMFWLLPEAAPNISCRSAVTQTQLKLSTASSVTELVALDRTADASEFAFDQERTDVLGLLFYEVGAHILLAVAHAVWDDADSMTGSTVEVIEYAMAGTANTPVTVTVDTQRWQATNSIWPSRNHGYFFADVANDDVIFTLALESGIVAFKRSVSGVQVASAWATDARRFGGRAGSVACVQQYLMECGYSGLKTNLGVIEDGGARLQLYKRDPLTLEYAAQTPIELADLISGLTTGEINRRAIFPVGLLQPLAEYPSAEDVLDSGWSHNLLSNRWPMLLYNARREWWIYLNAITSETAHNPRWLTVAVDAIEAAAEVVDTFAPDLTWRLLYDGLVATAEAELQAAADASREGEGDLITGGPVEYIDLDYEVDPGDPEADPPVPPQVETYSHGISGFRLGEYYTGTSLQDAGINPDTAPNLESERFYAAPLPAVSLPIGEEFTSFQTPSGVIDSAGRHYGVCFEPQHWADGLAAIDDLGPGPGEIPDQLYESSVRWHKWGEVDLTTANGFTSYLWWITKGVNFLGDVFDVDPPHFYVSGDSTTDPGGYYDPDHDGFPPFEPVGNTMVGEFNPVAYRNYSLKQHGEYTYQMRHRTQLTICNPDKSLRYRADLSRYYVDGGSDGYTSRYKSPQLLNVWQWQPVTAGGVDYLWVLRQDFLSLGALLDDGDNCVDCEQEPALELWEIGETEATLLHRLALHPTFDTNADWTDGTLLHPPYMLHGVQSDGKPYATVWTEWVGPSGEHGHLITEVLFTPGAPSNLTRSEKWGTGAKPANQPISVEARNAVHHSGKLYWIEGGTSVVYKDSA